jgi:hypothetical protein
MHTLLETKKDKLLSQQHAKLLLRPEELSNHKGIGRNDGNIFKMKTLS